MEFMFFTVVCLALWVASLYPVLTTLCVCVCVCVFKCSCLVCAFVCLYVCVCVRAYACAYVCAHARVCVFVYCSASPGRGLAEQHQLCLLLHGPVYPRLSTGYGPPLQNIPRTHGELSHTSVRETSDFSSACCSCQGRGSTGGRGGGGG